MKTIHSYLHLQRLEMCIYNISLERLRNAVEHLLVHYCDVAFRYLHNKCVSRILRISKKENTLITLLLPCHSCCFNKTCKSRSGSIVVLVLFILIKVYSPARCLFAYQNQICYTGLDTSSDLMFSYCSSVQSLMLIICYFKMRMV